MQGMANRNAIVAARLRSRFGLFLGTMALLWSAYLYGKDQSLSDAPRIEHEEAPQHVLVISIPDRKLAVMEDGRVLKVYPVAVGAAVSPSPTGTMRIVDKVIGPTYYHKGKVIPPGKSNPLGDRWMGLSQRGYGIHGTNVPGSIGKAASHGCIRMGKHDVEELFNLARVGDAVEIHGERDTQVAEIFGSSAAEIEASAQPARTAPTRITIGRASEVSQVVIASMSDETVSGE